MFRSFAALAAVMLMVPGVAGAGTVATVDAGFDPVLQNAYFTITDLSNDPETGLTLTTSFGPTTSVSLPDLAAGQSETYYFDQPNGGFLVGAGQNDLDDSTTYQLSLTLNGVSLSSNVFSPPNNLSGAYVDFLGNTCYGFSDGCPVATTGTVAAIPEPAAPAVLAIGLGVLALSAFRRRAI